jgi:hypothetical protein
MPLAGITDRPPADCLLVTLPARHSRSNVMYSTPYSPEKERS